LRKLQNYGHSTSDIFSILLDMEFNEKAHLDRIVTRAVQQGTIDGYLYFERDSSGNWDILLTELGRQRNWEIGNT
jgi:hypothetical protein